MQGDYSSTNIRFLKVRYFPDWKIDAVLDETDNFIERKPDYIIAHGGTNYLINLS